MKDSTVRKSLVLLGGMMASNRSIEPLQKKKDLLENSFQNPKGEMKLISCLKGKIWDVIIDLRSDSPTFLNWHAEVISENENDSLLIPKGFAHGFQTLENNCELVYLHSEFYYPEFEQGLRYDDPQLDISWPLEVTFCSNRDLNHKLLSEYEFSGI